LKVVANASVLISLSNIRQLHLLHERFVNGVMIPPAVWKEVVEQGEGRPGANEVAGGDWAGVTRFDTFHDVVHRDVISPDGSATQKWYLQLNFDEGLTFAYNDIEMNWERYREWYFKKKER